MLEIQASDQMYILWVFSYSLAGLLKRISISLCMYHRMQVEARGHLAGFTSLLHDMNVSFSGLAASDFS